MIIQNQDKNGFIGDPEENKWFNKRNYDSKCAQKEKNRHKGIDAAANKNEW